MLDYVRVINFRIIIIILLLLYEKYLYNSYSILGSEGQMPRSQRQQVEWIVTEG